MNPLFVGMTVDEFTLPESLIFTVDPFTTDFPISDDPAQYLDGDIVFDIEDLLAGLDEADPSLTPVLDFLGLSSFEAGVDLLDDLFDITDFSGGGDLTTASGSTPFTLDYDSLNNQIAVTDFDPKVVGACLSNACTLNASLGYGISLVVDEFLAFSQSLSDPDSSTAELGELGSPSPSPSSDLAAIHASLLFLKAANMTSVPLAEVEAELTVLTQPSFSTPGQKGPGVIIGDGVELPPDLGLAPPAVPPVSVPEPTATVGLLGAAIWMIQRRRVLFTEGRHSAPSDL